MTGKNELQSVEGSCRGLL